MTPETSKEYEVELQIQFLSVHILQIDENEDKAAIIDGIEVTLAIEPWGGSIGLKNWYDMDISSQDTDEHWNLFEDELRSAEESDPGIWQQILWEIQGIFLVPEGMPISEAVERIQFDLNFSHDFSEDQVSVDGNIFFKILSYSEIV